VISTAAIVLALLLAGGLVLLWRMYTRTACVATDAGCSAAVEAERARFDRQQATLRAGMRWRSPRSPEGVNSARQVLCETARTLGLREGCTSRCRRTWRRRHGPTDLVLAVGGGRQVPWTPR